MVRNRWAVFALCAGPHWMSMFFRASGAIIAPDLTRDLNLDFHALGLLGAAFFYSFALLQLPMGLVIDRFGGRLTVFVLCLVGGVGAAVFASATTLSWAIAGRLLLGIGMAGNLIGPLKIYTRWFRPNEFATILGLHLGLSTLGSTLATSPLAWLVQQIGWRPSFWLLGGLTVALGLLVLVLVRDEPPGLESPAAGPRAASTIPAGAALKMIFNLRDFWVISFASFIRYGAYAAIQTLWAGPFLMVALGLDQLSAGHVLLLLNVGFICGGPAGGLFSDRVAKSIRLTIQIGLTLMAFFVLALSGWTGGGEGWGLKAVFFGLGFAAAFANIMYAHMKELVPLEISGTALSGINFFTMIGAAVFTHALGGFLQGQAARTGAGFRQAFLTCAGLALLAALSYFWTRKKPGK